MYERNAIVLERYFEKIFSFTKEDNLKTNFENYIKIIETINEYKKIVDEEESAIVKYINESDENEKNRIFNTILYPALTKMIESIIRRYKLYVPEEEFDEKLKNAIDTIYEASI